MYCWPVEVSGRKAVCRAHVRAPACRVRKLDHACVCVRKREVVSGKVDLRESCRWEAWDRKCSQASLTFRPWSCKQSRIFLLIGTRYSPHAVTLHHKHHLSPDLSNPADNESCIRTPERQFHFERPLSGWTWWFGCFLKLNLSSSWSFSVTPMVHDYTITTGIKQSHKIITKEPVQRSRFNDSSRDKRFIFSRNSPYWLWNYLSS